MRNSHLRTQVRAREHTHTHTHKHLLGRRECRNSGGCVAADATLFRQALCASKASTVVLVKQVTEYLSCRSCDTVSGSCVRKWKARIAILRRLLRPYFSFTCLRAALGQKPDVTCGSCTGCQTISWHAAPQVSAFVL